MLPSIKVQVAHYVDTKYRKQATASTCYEKHTGEFLPVKDSTDFKYLFKEEYKDKYQFIKLIQLMMIPLKFMLIPLLISSKLSLNNLFF